MATGAKKEKLKIHVDMKFRLIAVTDWAIGVKKDVGDVQYA